MHDVRASGPWTRWLGAALLPLLLGCSKKAPSADARREPAADLSAVAPPPSASAPAPTASASAAPSPPRRTSCPYVLSGKPAAWKARVMGAGTPKALAAALGEVGGELLDPGADEDGTPRKPWTLEGVQLTPVALAGKAPVDFWAEARFSQIPSEVDAMGEGVISAALIKRDDGSYCALPGPAEGQAFRDHACFGGPERWPIAFHFLHVVDKDRMTVIAERSHGRCGDGCQRAGMDEIELLDVQGFDLATVFSHPLYAAHYSGCPYPPETWEQASVEWVGAYPRELIVTDEVGCQDWGRPPPRGLGGHCTPEASETRYTWTLGRYVQKGGPRPLATPYGALHVALVEGGIDDGSGMAWGGRCFRKLQDGKLDEAEIDCKRALGRASDPAVIASVHYNLALIAEKRGDLAAACKATKESLSVRPNNAATMAKRDEVCR
jgi:hypothetical protein